MNKRYDSAIKNGKAVFHRNYCLYIHDHSTTYDAGTIRLITLDHRYDPNTDAGFCVVAVVFADGSICRWTSRYISPYNSQFGIAVSTDGKYLFVQSWENGLLCFDSRTGEIIWKTKSKRGVTSIFVNENTILCHRREQALQLIDIHTGEVLEEKRPATSWGFTAIDHNHIVCRVTARKWEIIDAGTLAVKQVIPHKDFTGGHTDYCVNNIKLVDNELVVRGFKNVWDETVSPAKMLPDLKFEHRIPVELKG